MSLSIQSRSERDLRVLVNKKFTNKKERVNFDTFIQCQFNKCKRILSYRMYIEVSKTCIDMFRVVLRV